MNVEEILKRLEFCSLFSYCPNDNSEEGSFAKKVRDWIKNDTIVAVEKPIVRGEVKIIQQEMSYYVAQYLKNLVDKGYFSDFFSEDVILIPMPRSTSIRREQLWPAYQIAKAIENEKLGVAEPLIQRLMPIQKSSYAPPNRRPKPSDHFNSMGIKRMVDLDSKYVLLVDDIVTRGHTFMVQLGELK